MFIQASVLTPLEVPHPAPPLEQGSEASWETPLCFVNPSPAIRSGKRGHALRKGEDGVISAALCQSSRTSGFSAPFA